MAESSLSLGFADFQKAVGRYLGWGGTSGNWTTDQTDRIAEIIQAGVRKFYMAHMWSFLTPVDTLTTEADNKDYEMPDDFGGIVGSFTFAAGEGYPDIVITSEQQIRSLWQDDDGTGRPQYAAIRPLTSDGTDGQRFECIFYPVPDAAYVLTYAYNAIFQALSALAPYPLGGQVHAETIKTAILSIAELEMNDTQDVQAQRYMENLSRSVDYDNKVFSPKTLGYNGDGTGQTFACQRRKVTYNGVSY